MSVHLRTPKVVHNLRFLLRRRFLNGIVNLYFSLHPGVLIFPVRPVRRGGRLRHLNFVRGGVVGGGPGLVRGLPAAASAAPLLVYHRGGFLDMIGLTVRGGPPWPWPALYHPILLPLLLLLLVITNHLHLVLAGPLGRIRGGAGSVRMAGTLNTTMLTSITTPSLSLSATSRSYNTLHQSGSLSITLSLIGSNFYQKHLVNYIMLSHSAG